MAVRNPGVSVVYSTSMAGARSGSSREAKVRAVSAVDSFWPSSIQP